MKFRGKHLLFLALSATGAIDTNAATLVCSGTVTQLAYHQPGKLMLRLSSMNVPVFICNADSEWVVAGSTAGNTSATTCKTLYALFLSAKLAGSTIDKMYMDGDQVPTSCNSFASWTPVSVRYFEH